MTTELKRDLQVDLALCERASSGYMIHATSVVDEEGAHLVVDVTTEDCDTLTSDDAEFIVGSREGWPESIRRAIAAEEKWAKLRSVVVTNAIGGRGEDINDWDIMRNHMDELDSEVSADATR